MRFFLSGSTRHARLPLENYSLLTELPTEIERFGARREVSHSGCLQNTRSDSPRDKLITPERVIPMRTISHALVVQALPVQAAAVSGKAEAAAVPTKSKRFVVGQFSLFPENCSDWSIEMKWAGDITPRKNNS